jgi:hypothetical protein
MKKLIGTQFHLMRPHERLMLTQGIATLMSYQDVAASIERDLESQLTILRTISELFSTFDEEIFLYYFAQFFAQQHYTDYIKIAPYSEIKFDLPFESQKVHFKSVTESRRLNTPLAISRNKIAKVKRPAAQRRNFEIYLPQYQLGNYELLPYTSISGDILKNHISLDKFISSTILLDDSYENKVEKAIGTITETPVPHLNRIISDIFSFVHYLVNIPSVFERSAKLRASLTKFSPQISEQIFSKEDKPDDYPTIFADWLKAIENDKAITPFHITPYLLDKSDWNTDNIQLISQMIIDLLGLVNEICE